jgi:hypothetical protein
MAGIGRQALTVLLPLRQGREAALDATLGTFAPVLAERLRAATTLHFARLVVVPGNRGTERASPASLLFETTYDGELAPHVEELYALVGAELDALFAECEGAGGSGFEGFSATLQRGARPPRAFAAVNATLGVAEIRHDAALRDSVTELLARDRSTLGRLPPLEILTAVRGSLGLTASATPRRVSSAPSRSTEGALVGLLRLLPLLAGMVIHDLRERLHGLWHDRAEPFPLSRHPAAAPRGARSVQRAFTHLASTKPGRFRRGAVRRTLALVGSELQAGVERGVGIHALRFVLLDDGRLLFTDQQDGSLTSRLTGLGKLAKGLLAFVWSSTEGFPRTLLGPLLGRTDDDRWLEWLRAHELPAGFWYSAYPSLTTRDIRENAELRALLAEAPTESGARRLLELV